MTRTGEFKLALSLARRDLRLKFKGFGVFMACLFLGVTAIASVQSLSMGLLQSIFYDGKSLLGGDISLRTVYEPASPEQIRFLHDKMGPMTVVMETRAMARTADGRAATVELKAVDPFYPLYGSIEITDEAGQPADKILQEYLIGGTAEELDRGLKDWGALVERELLERLGLHINDRISIGDRSFAITGIIGREPDRVGALRFAIAPRIMISSAVFPETGLGRAGSQVYYEHKLYLPYVKNRADLEAAQQKIAAAFPKATWRGRGFLDASPALRRTISQLTAYLTLISFAALLIGGVGIGNSVRVFLEEKRDTIATFKCLGASARLVFGVYLSQILALATLAILAGILAGGLLPLAAGPAVTRLLALRNFIGIYPEALVKAALFGFLTVLAFGLWPLGQAARTRASDLFRSLVADARQKPGLKTLVSIVIAVEALAALVIFSCDDLNLALGFLALAVGGFAAFALAGWLVRLLARLAPKPQNPGLRLAVGNLHRPGNRTTSIIVSLGVGLTVLVAATQIEAAFTRLLTETTSQETPSFFFLDVQANEVETFTRAVQDIPGTRQLRLTPSLRGRILRINGKDAQEALVDRGESWVISSERGFTTARDLPPASTILEGEWWPSDYQGPPIISIADDVARAFGIGPGDELTVGILGREITARVANVRDIDWASLTMNFAVTFAPGILDSAPATRIGTVIAEPGVQTRLISELAQKFPHVTTVRVQDALDAAMKIMTGVSAAVRVCTGLMLVLGLLVLSGSIAASHKRRVYDAVVFKVLGATRPRILGGFAMEYALLGAITAVLSGALGVVIARLLQEHLLELKPHFSATALAQVTLLCLVITLLAGLLGTARALGQKPASLLRNQ